MIKSEGGLLHHEFKSNQEVCMMNKIISYIINFILRQKCTSIYLCMRKKLEVFAKREELENAQPSFFFKSYFDAHNGLQGICFSAA